MCQPFSIYGSQGLARQGYLRVWDSGGLESASVACRIGFPWGTLLDGEQDLDSSFSQLEQLSAYVSLYL